MRTSKVVGNLRGRFEYAKEAEARFLSHLDVIRVFERALRRAGLPVELSLGFNPHPKLSFAPALAVGIIGEREYVDIEFSDGVSIDFAAERLGPQLPYGFRLRAAAPIPPGSRTLTAAINRAEYRVECVAKNLVSAEELETGLKRLRDQAEILVEKHTKRGAKLKDIRPGMFCLEGKIEGGLLVLELALKQSSSGSVRPLDVIQALERMSGLPLTGESCTARRTGLYICENGKCRTPLEVL